MLKVLNIFVLFVLFAFVVLVQSCTQDKVVEPDIQHGNLEIKTFSDLPADVDRKPEDAQTYTHFSFKTGNIVENSEDWDLGFSETTIITNPNKSTSQILTNQDFNALTEAPETGYEEKTADNKIQWYNYNPETHEISAKPSVIVVRTYDGKFAKMRIISYYQGNPSEYTQENKSRYYTFDYVYQPDGSRNF